MVKKILLGLVAVLVIAQLFRPAKNLGTVSGPGDILVLHPAPAEVAGLLQNSCYDCHSNSTRYPWYAEVQPAGWWLASHITEGKEHLNFSEFGSLAPKRASRRLVQAGNEIDEGGMPLPSYTYVHRDARLNPDQRKLLIDWFESVRATLPPIPPDEKK